MDEQPEAGRSPTMGAPVGMASRREPRPAMLPVCPCCKRAPRMIGRFCTLCGELQYCPLCARRRSEGAHFCTGCGLDHGALKQGPPPTGALERVTFRASHEMLEERGTIESLRHAMTRLGERSVVDGGRLACAEALLSAVESIAGPDAIELFVDFRSHRIMPRRRVRWPGSSDVAIARHPWLEVACHLLDGTSLRLTSVTTSRIAPTKLSSGLGRFLPQRLERVSERVVFTLCVEEYPRLHPRDEERMRDDLAAALGSPCALRVLPDAVTLEFEFGPWFLRPGGAGQRVLAGYNLSRRMPPDAPARVLIAAYRALLTSTEERVL